MALQVISREELLTLLRAMPSSLNDALRSMELAADYIASVAQQAPDVPFMAQEVVDFLNSIGGHGANGGNGFIRDRARLIAKDLTLTKCDHERAH